MQDTLVFSIALNGYSILFKDCLESQKKYCQKFDFQYSIVEKTSYPLTNTDTAWLKLYLLREALKLGFKWIAFIDADCQIREKCPDFRKFMIGTNPMASMFMAHGFSGRINSGVIFFRNKPEARNFLNQVIKHRYDNIPEENQALYENGHIIHFGKNNPDIQIIDNTLWNNNYEINNTSFIQHYSGGILRHRYLKKNKIRAFVYNVHKKIMGTGSFKVDWEVKKEEILKNIIIQNFA
jgi:hypothetical protein